MDTSSFGKCDFGKGQGTKSKGQSTTIGGGVCYNCGESRTLSQRLLESIPKALGNGSRSNSTMKRVETRSAGHAGGKKGHEARDCWVSSVPSKQPTKCIGEPKGKTKGNCKDTNTCDESRCDGVQELEKRGGQHCIVRSS